MNASAEEILQYVREEDVKFIRLAFCDVFGRVKNLSVLPSELERAFTRGIAFNPSPICGIGHDAQDDLLLCPDPATISVLPWRPEHGRVVRMFCTLTRADGSISESDTRSLLRKAVSDAAAKGVSFSFGSRMEFYLFETDERGEPTDRPFDHAGYMDIAPEDKGENVRREICLTLEQMGILPESSHHEEGPGQNEIDFRHADPVTAADHALTFRSVVRTIAARNGLHAAFSPKPLYGQPGNGFHVHFSARKTDGEDVLSFAAAGIMEQISALTAFLNPEEESYARLGDHRAPKYITWSPKNRSQLLRIPEVLPEERRAELRSPDSTANPYLVFALLIRAGLYGIQNRLPLPKSVEMDLRTVDDGLLAGLQSLPENAAEARKLARMSAFVREYLPEPVIRAYCERA